MNGPATRDRLWASSVEAHQGPLSTRSCQVGRTQTLMLVWPHAPLLDAGLQVLPEPPQCRWVRADSEVAQPSAYTRMRCRLGCALGARVVRQRPLRRPLVDLVGVLAQRPQHCRPVHTSAMCGTCRCATAAAIASSVGRCWRFRSVGRHTTPCRPQQAARTQSSSTSKTWTSGRRWASSGPPRLHEWRSMALGRLERWLLDQGDREAIHIAEVRRPQRLFRPHQHGHGCCGASLGRDLERHGEMCDDLPGSVAPQRAPVSGCMRPKPKLQNIGPCSGLWS